MFLYLLAFAGGVLTIVSPCILPVLPFVFSRADQPFRRSGLPLLVGMAATFAVVAGVATFAGAWVVGANQIGRFLAIVIFALLGLALLFPAISDYLTRPLVRLGGKAQGPQAARQRQASAAPLLLGMSTGLLWAPCAGPILGSDFDGSRSPGGRARALHFFFYPFPPGAATSLAVALLAGNKVFGHAEEIAWVRRNGFVAGLEPPYWWVWWRLLSVGTRAFSGGSRFRARPASNKYCSIAFIPLRMQTQMRPPQHATSCGARARRKISQPGRRR